MMYQHSIMVLLLVPLLAAGCGSERKAKIDKVRSHRSGSIAFDYPRNWSITEDTNQVGVQNLFVESPGNAVVIIQAFPDEAEEDNALPLFAKQFSSGAVGGLPGKVSPSAFRPKEDRHGFKMLWETFLIGMPGTKLPHERTYAGAFQDGTFVVLIFQVASEDAAKAKPGFDLILKTFRFGKN